MLEFVFCFYVNRLILCSSSFILFALSSFLFHFYTNITFYHGIRASHSSANNTPTLEGSVVALIANSHKCARMYIGIADYTFSITLLIKASNSNSWLLPAHNQIRMMLGHDLFKILVLLRAPAEINLRLCCFSFSRERGNLEKLLHYDFIFFTLVSDSGFFLILFMKFFCVCWCVYYMFDISSN